MNKKQFKAGMRKPAPAPAPTALGSIVLAMKAQTQSLKGFVSKINVAQSQHFEETIGRSAKTLLKANVAQTKRLEEVMAKYATPIGALTVLVIVLLGIVSGWTFYRLLMANWAVVVDPLSGGTLADMKSGQTVLDPLKAKLVLPLALLFGTSVTMGIGVLVSWMKSYWLSRK